MVRQRSAYMPLGNQTSSPSCIQRYTSMKSILIACFGLALCIILALNGSGQDKTIINTQNEAESNEITPSKDSYTETTSNLESNIQEINREELEHEQGQEFSSENNRAIHDNTEEQESRIEEEEMNSNEIEEENNLEEEIENEEEEEIQQELEEEEAEVAEEQAEIEEVTNESMTRNEDVGDEEPRSKYSRSRYSNTNQSGEEEQTKSNIKKLGHTVSSGTRSSPKQYDRFSSRYGTNPNKYDSNTEEEDTVEDGTVPSLSSVRGQAKSSYHDGMTKKISQDVDEETQNTDVDEEQDNNARKYESTEQEGEGEDVTLPNSGNERIVIKPIADEEVQDAVEETADELQTVQKEAVKEETESMMSHVGKSVNALVRHGLLMLTHSSADEEILSDKEKDLIVQDVQEQIESEMKGELVEELKEQTNDVASEIIETISNKAAAEVAQGETSSDVSNTIEMEEENGTLQIEDEIGSVGTKLVQSPELMDQIKQRSFFAEKVAVEKVLSSKFHNHAKVSVDKESGAIRIASMSGSSATEDDEEDDTNTKRGSYLRKHKQNVASNMKKLGIDEDSDVSANGSNNENNVDESTESEQDEGFETQEQDQGDNEENMNGIDTSEEEQEAEEAYEQDQQEVEREVEDINDGPVELPTVSMLIRGNGSKQQTISNEENESTAEEMESLPSISSLVSKKKNLRDFRDSDQDSEDP